MLDSELGTLPDICFTGPKEEAGKDSDSTKDPIPVAENSGNNYVSTLFMFYFFYRFYIFISNCCFFKKVAQNNVDMKIQHKANVCTLLLDFCSFVYFEQ